MTDYRIWHSSRDPYHCAFRLISILLETEKEIHIEKLRILDMYFLYPTLLHRLSLPNDVKTRFRTLKIKKPEKSFVRLPSTASVWQELQVFQSTALKQLAGRGLLRRDALRDHHVLLEAEQVPSRLQKRAAQHNSEEKILLTFLTDDVAKLPVGGPTGLVKRAGIPARGPIQ